MCNSLKDLLLNVTFFQVKILNDPEQIKYV